MSDANRAKFGVMTENSVVRAARYLRLIYPVKTADRVSADTGVPANTVAKWLSGAARPNCPALLSLISAYGPDFLFAVMPNAPEWLDRAARSERQAELEREIAARTSELEAMR